MKQIIHSSINRKHVKVHCFTGNSSLFPRRTCAKKAPEMGIGNRIGEDLENFYSHLKFILRLKDVKELKSEIFSEETRN